MRCLIARRVLGVALVSALAWAMSNAASAADILRVDDRTASAAHAKILEQLAAKTKLEFIETPLSDVVDYLKDLHNIEIQLDRRALTDVGISFDTPVTKTLNNIALRSALRIMLRDLELTYLIEDEVLLITTQERADSRLELRVYNVADLVVPSAPEKTPPVRRTAPTKTEPKPDAKPADESKPAANKAEAAKARAVWTPCDDLIEAITSTVAPATWDQVAGPGSIAPFQSGGLDVLIISQTRDVHEKIEDLLATLRKMRTGK